GDAVSSSVPVRITVAPLVIVGASFTLVTVIDDVALAVLNAVVPPLDVASTFVPCTPLVCSQAWKVTDAVVPFTPSGTNRSLSFDRSKRAELFAIAPTAAQVVPPSVENCHTPVLLTSLVTAMPLNAAVSTSDAWPEMNVETRSPLLVV